MKAAAEDEADTAEETEDEEAAADEEADDQQSEDEGELVEEHGQPRDRRSSHDKDCEYPEKDRRVIRKVSMQDRMRSFGRVSGTPHYLTLFVLI